MSSKLKNLSENSKFSLINAETVKIGIVISEWNTEITGALLDGAKETLLENGILEKNIKIEYVPGSFELPLGAQFLIEFSEIDAVICLGCVIQGETRHFDFICDSVANGITKVNLDYNCPVIFGVLTTNDFDQAKQRSGGNHGNKGVEAGITALKMINLKNKLKK